MLQQNRPGDYVCSTGVSHTVRDLVVYVFDRLGRNWKKHVSSNSRFMRPEELSHLKGDCSKAVNILGWKHKYTFETMLDEMIQYWLDELKDSKK
jgi:GDPmannose 4,6-dehydratase